MLHELSAGLLIILSFVTWRMLRPRPVLVRLSIGAALFVALTIPVAQLVGSPLDPVFASQTTGIVLLQQAVVAVWWLLAAKLLVEAIRMAFLRGILAHEGRLFSDLLAGLIYLAASLSIVGTVFGLPIRALVATSGVIAIVLGLALQNTLSDVFSGIAVGIERPYAIGDRIWIEGPVEGIVVQINWRSVSIRTDKNDIATIPNSLAAKSRIVNRNVPTAQRSDAVHVPCPAAIPPETVFELMRNAILLCPAVLETPAPFISLSNVGKRFNTYELGFSVANSGVLGTAKSTVLIQVLRQFRAAGIGVIQEQPSESREARATAIHIPLFQALTADQLGSLECQLLDHRIEPGAVLFSEGDTDGSLFIVVSGVLDVSRKSGGASSSVGRISAGDYIGEIALLTGAPHAATVTALTSVVAFELKKAHLGPLLASQPELMHSLEISARRGQEILDRNVAASVGAGTVPSGPLLSLIRDYFRNHLLP